MEQGATQSTQTRTPMSPRAQALIRRRLTRDVWPDKFLYGVIMLTISGALGLVQSATERILDISFGNGLAPWVEAYPAMMTPVLSFAAMVLGLAAWRRLSLSLGVIGALCGIASFSLFGIGALHAVAALVFLFLAMREGEHRVHPKDRVGRYDWPDKSLAASMLLLMAGITSVAWGLATVTGSVAFSGANGVYWGTAQLISGFSAVAAAAYLSYQRAPLFGLAAGILVVGTMGAYLLAPGLGIAGLIALRRAWREGEFEPSRITTGHPAAALPRPRSRA